MPLGPFVLAPCSLLLLAVRSPHPQEMPLPTVRVHAGAVRHVAAARGPMPRPSASAGSGAACTVSAAGVHGEPVPGGGTLDPFAGGNPASIEGDGGGAPRIAFFAQVAGAARNQGVFAHDGTTLMPLAVGCGALGGAGDPPTACGDPTPLGGTFGGFFSGTPFAPAVNEAGDVLFLAEVDGGSSPRGLFLHRASTGALESVAAVGTPSPAGGTFAMVGPGALNAGREVVFLASGSTAGPSDVFLWRNGVLSVVARVGDPAPGGGSYQFLGSESLGFVDGTTIPTGPVPDINDQGVIVFRAVTTGALGRGFVRTDSGPSPVASFIVTDGEATPAGGTFLDFGAATVNESGEFAFFADFKPTPMTFSAGWFAGSAGNWRTGLAFFDPVGAGECFGLAFSRNPMTPLDDQGNLLIWTDVRLPGGAMQEHLVLRARDGALSIVSKKGDPTPIGGTYNGFDAWPSLDRHGRGAIGAFTPGAGGGAVSAHFVFELCPVASSSARNGQGVNPACFAAPPPVLGATWDATVDASAHPGAGPTAIVGFTRPLFGRLLPFGELLVDPASTRLFLSAAASGGGVAVHSHAIPDALALAGFRAYLQAVILGGSAELCNAVDVVLGT